MNAGARRAKKRLSILITAGPTREFLDTVRFISNPSSGKMGYAIAEAAAAAGHRVTLVSGPVGLEAPRGVRIVQVTTAAEMLSAARAAFRRSDAAIFTAAVCDYRPRQRASRKLPKSKRKTTLILVPTPDIAATLGRRKGPRKTIGFALEDHDGRAHAEAKLRSKNCDAIVLNDPATVADDRASVEYLERGGKWQRWPRAAKSAVASRLIRALERMANKPGRGDYVSSLRRSRATT